MAEPLNFPRRALFAVGLLGTCLLAAEPPTWKIDKVSLAPESDLVGRLTVGLSKDTTTFEITSEVRLTALSDHFVVRDRLVVVGEVGEHGRASGVVIFDLTNRKLLDWFVCWEATRVSESWIAFVEWYPEHGERWPTDVVLVYDLDKSPSQNRVGKVKLPFTAPSIADASVAAGIPVYPYANAVEESYANLAPSAESAIRVLGAPYFLLLPSRWLVFVAVQGKDYPSSQNRLVVVDLSHGLRRCTAKTVDIPREGFTKYGRNPKMIQIDRMEAVGEHSVRLFLPESEYGVGSEVVNLAGKTPE
jgi:hypothetical protein